MEMTSLTCHGSTGVASDPQSTSARGWNSRSTLLLIEPDTPNTGDTSTEPGRVVN